MTQKTASQLIDQARHFATAWDFVAIPEIRIRPDKLGATWGFDGIIEIGAGCEVDVLAHEIFHSAFHKSPLHEFAEPWGDGFCNAFAYHMTDGRAGIPLRRMSHTYLLGYHIPEVLILNEAPTYNRFHYIWQEWNYEARLGRVKGFLDKKLGFTPSVGFTR